MRLFKLIFALIIIGLIALFVWQNTATWKMAIPFQFEVPLLGHSAPNVELYLVMLFSAFIGFLFGAAIIIKPYLKARRNLARERREKKESASLPMRESQAEAS